MTKNIENLEDLLLYKQELIRLQEAQSELVEHDYDVIIEMIQPANIAANLGKGLIKGVSKRYLLKNGWSIFSKLFSRKKKTVESFGDEEEAFSSANDKKKGVKNWWHENKELVISNLITFATAVITRKKIS